SKTTLLQGRLAAGPERSAALGRLLPLRGLLLRLPECQHLDVLGSEVVGLDRKRRSDHVGPVRLVLLDFGAARARELDDDTLAHVALAGTTRLLAFALLLHRGPAFFFGAAFLPRRAFSTSSWLGKNGPQEARLNRFDPVFIFLTLRPRCCAGGHSLVSMARF